MSDWFCAGKPGLPRIFWPVPNKSRGSLLFDQSSKSRSSSRCNCGITFTSTIRGPFIFLTTTSNLGNSMRWPCLGYRPAWPSAGRPPIPLRPCLFVDVDAERALERDDRQAGLADQGAVVLLEPVVFVEAEFVADLADDGAQQVVERDEADRALALFADQGEVRARRRGSGGTVRCAGVRAEIVSTGRRYSARSVERACRTAGRRTGPSGGSRPARLRRSSSKYGIAREAVAAHRVQVRLDGVRLACSALTSLIGRIRSDTECWRKLQRLRQDVALVVGECFSPGCWCWCAGSASVRRSSNASRGRRRRTGRPRAAPVLALPLSSQMAGYMVQ